jgi:hypothetical protein
MDRADFQLVQRFPAMAQDQSIIAFSVSTTGQVADIIRSNEQIDYVRVAHAFTRAGLPNFN